MNEYFVKLNTESKCVPKLKSLIPTLEFKLVYGDNNAAILDPEILKEDEKIYDLIKKFKIDITKKISIFKVSPKMCYSWHTDGVRRASINMLLSGYDSFTLMGKRQGIFFVDVEKVPYEPNRYILLNTWINHSVYNFTEERYLLSLGIPLAFKYNDVVEYIKENEL